MIIDKLMGDSLESDSSEPSLMCEKSPYEFSPSYFYHNGKVGTVVQLYVRTGSNRQMTFREIIDFIPTSTLDDVNMFVIIDDSLIKYDEKKRLIRSNAGSNKDAIDDQKAHGDRRHEVEDVSSKIMQESDIEDYDDYERILDSAEPVVVFRICLVITGPTQAAVEEQLQLVNVVLDQRHEGASWDSLGGDQYKRFTEMFSRMEHSRFVMTSTASNYAGLNFAVNSGLRDRRGVPIGIDSLALSSATAFFDFNGYTKRLGVIASPSNCSMPFYHKKDSNRQFPVSSLIAQCASNHVVMNGGRVKHLVLNDFNYFEPGSFYRPVETADIFAKYDVSKMTINPLQGFGRIEDVVKIFSRLTQKIVNIFDLLEDLRLTQDQKAIVLNVIERFYFNHSLWTVDAEKYPKRTRIVDIDKPETYPTMGLLINEFTSIAQSAARENRELKADRVDALQAILSQSLTAHMGVLGRTTSIKDDDSSLQTYYEFSEIDSMSMTQVQFINILDYVIWTCKPGDMIVIHGAQKLYNTTLNMVRETIEYAQKLGVRFIFAYDTIVAQDSKVDKMSDVFKLKGSFYTDLDTDVDWSIIGKMTDEEVNMYETAMNTALSDIIRVQATAKLPCQALVHRSAGEVNNFVNMRVLI